MFLQRKDSRNRLAFREMSLLTTPATPRNSGVQIGSVYSDLVKADITNRTCCATIVARVQHLKFY